MAGKLRLFALRLLLDQPFDFGNYDLFAVDRSGHRIRWASIASRATGREQHRADHYDQPQELYMSRLHVSFFTPYSLRRGVQSTDFSRVFRQPPRKPN